LQNANIHCRITEDTISKTHSDNVSLVSRGVDCFQVFNIIAKDQNRFLNAKLGLKALTKLLKWFPGLSNTVDFSGKHSAKLHKLPLTHRL